MKLEIWQIEALIDLIQDSHVITYNSTDTDLWNEIVNKLHDELFKLTR